MPKQLPWEQYRQNIYQRYIDEDRTLPEVRRIMEEEHGFKARCVSIQLSRLSSIY
jgi:hypothetical protein